MSDDHGDLKAEMRRMADEPDFDGHPAYARQLLADGAARIEVLVSIRARSFYRAMPEVLPAQVSYRAAPNPRIITGGLV